jgi:hypothetical protein
MRAPLHRDTRHGTRNTCRFSGSFAPASTDPPTALKGSGFTVAYVSTGRWRVTIAGAYADCLEARAGVQFNAAPGTPYDCGVIGAITAAPSSSSAVFDILYRENAVAANPAVHANARVNFDIELQLDS